MLERESHGTGWQVTLRASGVGRFAAAAFLGAWLCGWAVGEVFAGVTLLAGLRDTLAPQLELSWLPHMTNAAPANPWPVMAFLAVWLTFWTLGGVFAMHQVARLLVGADQVRWDHDGVEVRERAGPFGTTRRIAWRDAHGFEARLRGRLVFHTRRGLWPVTGFGGAEERGELGDWLRAAWREAGGGREEAREAAASAPPGWLPVTGVDGREMLTRDPRARRAGAIVVAAVAGAFAFGSAGLAGAAHGVAAWVGVVVFALLALLCAAGAAWLAFGGDEIRPLSGALLRTYRFAGREWTHEFAPVRLALERGYDSDGDETWSLVASSPARRATLATNPGSPGGTRHLGLWLAARTGVPLEGQPGELEASERRAG